jgi:hypothetical protein
MKYFIDTEFKEYFKQHRLLGIPVGYKTPTIDLISIAITSEDGREYYALNKECDLKEIWNDEWLRENVLMTIYRTELYGGIKNHIDFSYSGMKWIFKIFGETKDKIAKNINSFVNPKINELRHELVGRMFDKEMSEHTIKWNKFIVEHNVHLEKFPNTSNIYYKPEFYAYYADYDWVVFCQLFGRMMNLPKGFPMYCKDLKQMMDDCGLDKEWKRINCPDPIGEHNALVDARWNAKLFSQIALKKQMCDGKK